MLQSPHEAQSGAESQRILSRANVVEFLASPALVCDLSGKIIQANSALMNLIGDDCLGDHHVTEFVSDGWSEATKAKPCCLRKKGGKPAHVSMTAEALRSADGTPIGSLVFFSTEKEVSDESHAQTISEADEELQKSRRELIAAREASAKAIRAKSEFLSNMSHELRTPLNAVIGMSEMLWESALTPDQRNLLSVLMNGGKNLLTTINDILEYSRLESGQLPLEPSCFILGATIERVVEMMRPLAERKGIQLQIAGGSILQEEVVGDSKRLEQVLTNLIGNAVKFTDSGHVTVRCARKVGNGSSAPDVVFSVEDTGIGIDSERLSVLFQRFSQADMSITKTYGGTGLGLAICKQLVELMGGAIWVESVRGEGSTFHFTVKLPLPGVSSENTSAHLQNRESSKKQDSAATMARFAVGLRILVVEDSKDNAFLITNYLKNIDCTLDFAENGQVAVEKFESQEYDLILMDMQMPEMDGYSATRWIRVLERQKSSRIPIIALTAYAFPEEVQRSFDAGCDAHLTKPIEKKKLLDSIMDVLEKEAGGTKK